MKQIEVGQHDAQIGDRVVNGSTKGSVCGVDTQEGAVLVIWDGIPSGRIDVLGLTSPVWMHFKVYGSAPDTMRDEQPGTERYAIEVPPGFEPVRDADGRATGIAPVLTLPWGNNDANT